MKTYNALRSVGYVLWGDIVKLTLRLRSVNNKLKMECVLPEDHTDGGFVNVIVGHIRIG